jgi:glucosamine--fructose-6-phosphate aminotransferase (isomerizing)
MRRGALHSRGAGNRRRGDQTFLAQITANYLVGLALAQARGTKYGDEVAREYQDLESMPTLVTRVLDDLEPIAELSRRFASSPTVLCLGRHVRCPVALEGVLTTGGLQHGPTAPIDDGVPVIVDVPRRDRTFHLHPVS